MIRVRSLRPQPILPFTDELLEKVDTITGDHWVTGEPECPPPVEDHLTGDMALYDI